jgi:hypothetical protein
MPEGSQGQKRPADVIGNAVHVMRIAIAGPEKWEPKTNDGLSCPGYYGAKKWGTD